MMGKDFDEESDEGNSVIEMKKDLDTGHWTLDIGHWTLEFGNW
jgi:hypothetical protein